MKLMNPKKPWNNPRRIHYRGSLSPSMFFTIHPLKEIPGSRAAQDGKLRREEQHGEYGSYWSSLKEGDDSAYFLYVGGFTEMINSFYREGGMLVRCVAK